MICAVCYGVLRGHQGSQWRGTFDLHFDHQANRTELKKSADMSCAICRSILHGLSRVEERDWKGTIAAVRDALQGLVSGDVFRHQTQLDRARISAYLSEIYGQQKSGVYRLDFKRQDSERVGTFVLQQIDQTGGEGAHDGEAKSIENARLLHTPFSGRTSSDEVLEIAKGWINDCLSDKHPACPGVHTRKPWYPTRLIDMGAPAHESGKPGERVNPGQVRLVLKAEEPPNEDEVYVTLSHCWGKANFIRLEDKKDVIDKFKKGIQLNHPTFPKSFRDAIDFARRLGRKVRYIWIDSLCIMQGSRKDWLNESANMYEIYRNSYCNISATAAADSTKGLYFNREPRELWEDEINLNVDGIPGQEESQKHPIQRCSILDLSFWERNVDDAPVNRRAWVLQERLMAPRVVHFCEDQIAWECGQLDAAESFRDGLPRYRLKGGDVVPGDRLKYLPTPGLNNADVRMSVYRRWKQVVEVYSKTKLTKPEDKLIALSGIARMMSQDVGYFYVAGLWGEFLESQLLWRVDPVYEKGVFSYPSQRSKDYRAPSFSWAAIDAPQGVTYGEITPRGLLIEVVEVNVVPLVADDQFGLVESGYVKVAGTMKKIVLKKFKTGERTKNTRYAWNLETKRGKQKEEFRNVFLDSPDSDVDILGSEGHIYCLPARMDDKGYLICLLLQLERKGNKETGFYKRIGITKVPPYDVSGQKKVKKMSGDEPAVPGEEWNTGAQKYTICIV